jgi:hypothetical protein
VTDTNKRRRAVPIIAAALLLVVLVLLAGRGPRWHLVFVDVAGPAGAGPEATPRLAGLRDAGAWVEIPGALPDRATIDQLADDLALGGYRVVEFTDAAGSSSRAVTDAVLESSWSHGPVSGLAAVLVRYRPAGAADFDRELGRLVDGMATPMPAARTLFVVLDRRDRSVTLAGPRGLRSGDPPPSGGFVPWLLGILRVSES